MKRYRNICIAVFAVIALIVGSFVAVKYVGNGPEGKDALSYEQQDIIKSVGSSDVLKVTPGENVTLLIVAKNGAEVYVRWGSSRYDAPMPAESNGYSAYFVKIKIPDDKNTIASMGKIVAVASLDGETHQLDGPSVEVVASTAEKTTAKSNSSAVYDIENYNPTYIDAEQQVELSINEAISKATTNSYTTPFTGNQMAVVTADYADTKPLDSDSDYVPYFPALAKGTMDFVVGESSSIDEDEGTTYYYYDLASGMKVKRDSVVLQPATEMPENSLKVNSVYASDGDLTIRLKSNWKVPYFASLDNQYYYSAYGKIFNVSDFSATGLSVTFNYTTSVYGEIDCSNSDVAANAYWTMKPENKTAALHFNFRQPGAYYGYSLYYEGDETVIILKGKPHAANGSVVVLDPGHGFDDGGASGLSGVVKESDINILVAYQVKAALEQQGVTVYMTRYGDDDINLDGRKIFARNVKPDLFVSIHSDASQKASSIGTTAYYYKPFSMPLATNIYNEMLSVYRNYLYPGQYDVYDEIARGVRYYPFAVTRLDECPSVLIEIGFMSNDAECYMLTRSENQKLIGEAIARGICTTLTR